MLWTTGLPQSVAVVSLKNTGHIRLIRNSNLFWIRWIFILSISDAMSDEYKKRYNKKFIPFHNPIEVELWAPFTKKDFKIDKKYVNILYSGRIGDNGIAESVVEVASAIDSMKDGEANIKLHIQTPTKDRRIY